MQRRPAHHLLDSPGCLPVCSCSSAPEVRVACCLETRRRCPARPRRRPGCSPFSTKPHFRCTCRTMSLSPAFSLRSLLPQLSAQPLLPEALCAGCCWGLRPGHWGAPCLSASWTADREGLWAQTRPTQGHLCPPAHRPTSPTQALLSLTSSTSIPGSSPFPATAQLRSPRGFLGLRVHPDLQRLPRGRLCRLHLCCPPPPFGGPSWTAYGSDLQEQRSPPLPCLPIIGASPGPHF